MVTLDGKDMVLGRVATYAAKQLLNGKRIEIVNAENMVVTGTRKNVLARFRQKSQVGVKGNPRKGPKFYRRPDHIVRETVQGMLPLKTARGRTALKKLRVHIGNPGKVAGEKLFRVEGAANRKTEKFLHVKDISAEFGYWVD